jgi:hypothetical protein
MSIDDTLKRERQIMQAVRDRNVGLEPEGVMFAHKVCDSWEIQQAARDARNRAKRLVSA